MSENDFETAVKAARLLPAQQKAVLKSLARGSRRKEISDELGLTLYTVNNYLAVVYGKLRINNSQEATRVAISAFRL